VIIRLIVATRETTTRKIANGHRRLAIDTQAFDAARRPGVLVFF
jgi:hypothetical protein